MVDLLTYGLPLVALLIVAALIYRAALRRRTKSEVAHPAVKQDWLPTGRIDFATELETGEDSEKPTEFKLLIEEHRIVESVAGNENVEIQWRLATLSEARAVRSHYHKYMAENWLIKFVPTSPPRPATTQDSRP
jgi:hypothetical protein